MATAEVKSKGQVVYQIWRASVRESLCWVTKSGRRRTEPYWILLGDEGQHIGVRKAQDGSFRWIARYRNAEAKVRKYKKLGRVTETNTYENACRRAHKFFRDCEQGIVNKDYTVWQVCEFYVAARRLETQEKGERVTKDIVRKLRRYVKKTFGNRDGKFYKVPLGDHKFKKLTGAILTDWRDATYGKNSSRNRLLSCLKAALHWGIRNKLASLDQALEWKEVKRLPVVDNRRDIYLDLEQRRKFVEHADPCVKSLIKGCALMGPRPGEMARARVCQFDPRTRTMKFIGKTGTRVIRISPAAVEFLTELCKGKQPLDWIITYDGVNAYKDSNWDDKVREAATKAELPKGTCLYSLRHSWITDALLGNVKILDAANLAGTSVQMIQEHYGHLVQDQLDARLAAVAML